MQIRCPHCQNGVELVDDSDFQSVDCPSCGSQFGLVDVAEDNIDTLRPGDDVPEGAERTGRQGSGMIAHFELIMFGPKVPKGMAYGYTEGGNGELGFFVVSDGSGRPYKCHVRAPCFALMQGLGKIITGGMYSDIIPTFDMLNLIAGECDR